MKEKLLANVIDDGSLFQCTYEEAVELKRLAAIGRWVETNHNAIFLALYDKMRGLAVAQISQFERALDSYRALGEK